MRSGPAAAMGIGGILMSFGAVSLSTLFARSGDTRGQLPAMTTVAVGSLVVSAVMFVPATYLAELAAAPDRRWTPRTGWLRAASPGRRLTPASALDRFRASSPHDPHKYDSFAM